MSDLPIRPYDRVPAAFHAWDPATVDVAAAVARLVASARPGTRVEHVGSSAVSGLPGKNTVDLGIEADPEDIPAITEAVLSLGFGRQGGIAPFPPTRPMFTGTVDHGGAPYRVHLHVMPPARAELAELVAFRDALRADPDLCRQYAEAKRRIVGEAADGQSTELYTARKADFVLDALYRTGIRRPPADRAEPLAPGSTIGIMGGGQLGRMLAVAARAMGFRIVALDPDRACPIAAVADELIVGRYDDVDAARRLGERSDVVTYELEHVGLDAATAAAEHAPLRPGLAALRATQDRLAERRFIRELGEYTAPWREIHGIAEGEVAAEALGYPCRLKLPLGGYDGRNQARIRSRSEVAAAVRSLGGEDGRPLLLEAEIDFASELSVILARDRDGRTRAFPVSHNVHDSGILVESVAPASIEALQSFDAAEIAERLARSLDLVGVLTVELFQLRGGGLMINELAPRVHNSGHWSIEGAATSQFEQQVRAILGLPLGSVEPRGTTAMVNLLGTGTDREARLGGVPEALRDAGVHLHVYGKRRVFERRKMGHVTVVGSDADEALSRARRAHAALRWEV
ncbi:MAG TPA: 5-(carboxyamino)imidazole ribonucleotide synthase [Candidatus Limnocylindrales bacterium]|nr:5-(carboxyamino)imidazole ribonucleotide synthase [Candidatus Limnocylindrales bacterium]